MGAPGDGEARNQPCVAVAAPGGVSVFEKAVMEDARAGEFGGDGGVGCGATSAYWSKRIVISSTLYLRGVVSSVALPFAGERLESVVQFGNGKDLELRIAFATGRRLKLEVGGVRVEVDGGVVVDTSCWDDVSLLIEYRGPDLSLHSGRFGDGEDGVDADFTAEAQSWLATGCEGELSWVVEAEIRLNSMRA
jgi:hypothetical protein